MSKKEKDNRLFPETHKIRLMSDIPDPRETGDKKALDFYIGLWLEVGTYIPDNILDLLPSKERTELASSLSIDPLSGVRVYTDDEIKILKQKADAEWELYLIAHKPKN